MPNGVIYFEARQGQPSTLTARQRLPNGAYITQAALTAIAYKVWDLRQSPPVAILTGTINIVASVFDTLQPSRVLYPADTLGYNFKWITPQLAFPNAGNAQNYQVDVIFTDTSSEKFSITFLTSKVVPVQSSPL